MDLYSKRGVSAQKDEVHTAIRNLNQGLFKNSFCKIYPDFWGGCDEFVNIMHTDGAGTKSILAYLYWKETGDISVWKGIAQDAIVMNLDDLLCVGVHDNIAFSSTIDRNKHLIPGEVLEQIINGSQEIFNTLKNYNINIHYMGGETADIGDSVRSIVVNGTMACRWPKDKIITNNKIRSGDVIVGFAGYGQASYEKEYNSGIGSNGLTSARHDILNKFYAENFKESYDNQLPEEIIYIGNHRLTDKIIIDKKITATIGKLLLSPTRTFSPVLKILLQDHFDKIHGLIHCSGGGQVKCIKYLPESFKIIKDNLFEPPPIFNIIQQNSGCNNKEMYKVFNMGCRLEIYCDAKNAETIIAIANQFNIFAQIIGKVNQGNKKEIVIKLNEEEFSY